MNGLIPAWVDGTLGAVDKIEVHRRGLRHPAVSVFVMRGEQTLIQRRAMGKYHTPGLWANSCCTHAHWGEPAADCAVRRLRQELGLERLTVEPRGQIEYRAEVGAGMVEHELVDLFVAHLGAGVEPQPDPSEVMAVEWIGLEALAEAVRNSPERFTPWLRIYIAEGLGEGLRDLVPGRG